MKILSKIFFTVLLLGVLLLNTTCGKQYNDKYVTYEGYVYKYNDTPNVNHPLQGRTIILDACGGGSGDKASYGCPGYQFEIGRSTTDASGHFYIHGKAARSGLYYPVWDSFGGFLDAKSETDLSSPQYTNIYLRN